MLLCCQSIGSVFADNSDVNIFDWVYSVVSFQLTPPNSVIIDEYKQEMAAAKQYLRQSMVVSLADKPSAAEAKTSEDKDKLEPVCDMMRMP